MTAKDKAMHLYHQYYTTLLPNVRMRKGIAIQHALIAVDEMIAQCEDANFGGFSLYWESVKQELLNLQNNV